MKHATTTFALLLALVLPAAALASPPPTATPAPGATDTSARAVHRKMHRPAKVGTASPTRQHATVPAARAHARTTQPASSSSSTTRK